MRIPGQSARRCLNKVLSVLACDMEDTPEELEYKYVYVLKDIYRLTDAHLPTLFSTIFMLCFPAELPPLH